jgi:hypothetical protein
MPRLVRLPIRDSFRAQVRPVTALAFCDGENSDDAQHPRQLPPSVGECLRRQYAVLEFLSCLDFAKRTTAV